ncbi:MAG TPA: recombinase family protein [Thermoanaerobaculia bacterium]|nr:recombinase family protein [Thermoanaerobaculia bacterium]
MKKSLAAVAYARVSTAEQESGGYSIAAQKRLLTEYARKLGITIVEWFVEARSGKPGGDRREFRRLCTYVQAHPTVRIVLCEKTDRWARNLSDAEVVERCNLELHLVREHLVISPTAPTNQHLQHEIGLVIARNFLRNLRQEIIKGMTAKAQAGLWPSVAPAGYTNCAGKDRSIVPDPEVGPLVQELFRRAATGKYSGRELTTWARSHGLRTRRGGTIAKNTVLSILRNSVYHGPFRWAGKTYSGTHEPLISVSLFQQVQRALGVSKSKARHAFTFNGLLRCETCGGLLSTDEKTKRRELPDGTVTERKYRYLHCGGKDGCKRTHYREEFFDTAIADMLRSLTVESATSHWLDEQMGALHARELEQTAGEVQRLRQQKHGWNGCKKTPTSTTRAARSTNACGAS